MFFPVGTDRPARRRPAALDLPVPSLHRAGSGWKHSRAFQPLSLSQRRYAEPVCSADWPGRPRSACVLTRGRRRLHRPSPQGTRGGYCHPAAADAAACALRALRRTAPATRRGVPPALRVLPAHDGPACQSASALTESQAQALQPRDCAKCRTQSPHPGRLCVGPAELSLLSCGCCRSPMSAGAGARHVSSSRHAVGLNA